MAPLEVGTIPLDHDPTAAPEQPQPSAPQTMAPTQYSGMGGFGWTLN